MRWTLLFLLAAATLFSQPNPSELASNWWNYFEVPQDQLNNRIDEFTSSLKKLPAIISEENKSKANDLIEKITVNLQSYYKLALLPTPITPPPPPLKTSYTIHELLDLNHSLSSASLELKASTEAKNEMTRQIEVAQQKLDQVILKYGTLEPNSEIKLLTGLELIANRTTIELDKKKIANLTQTIEVQTATINRKKDEISRAIQAIESTPSELNKLKNLVKETERALQQALKTLKDREADQAIGATKIVNEDTEVTNQILSQLVSQAEIEAALAKNKHLLALIELTLSSYLQNQPYEPKIVEWSEAIKEIKEKILLWEQSSKRSLQRAGQLLLDKKQDAKPSPLVQKIIDTSQENLLLIERLKGEIQDTQFLNRVLDRRLLFMKSFTEKWYTVFYDWYSAASEATSELFSATLFYIGQMPVTAFGLIRFFAILIATFYISRLVVRGLNELASTRKGIRKAVIYRINRLVQYLILVIGVIIGLVFLGFDLSNLIILAGALGVGLGFGLQAIFNNFISGIIILFQSQLRVGDYIELESGMRGEIREINVRSTVILTNDGLEALIPNSEILNTKIINWTLRDPYRRVRIPFSVAYGTDIDRMRDLVVEAAKTVNHTLIKIGVPEPRVFLEQFGDSSIDFKLVVWVNERSTRRVLRTKSAYLWEIHDTLKENGIKIPFPQRDVHMVPHDK